MRNFSRNDWLAVFGVGLVAVAVLHISGCGGAGGAPPAVVIDGQIAPDRVGSQLAAITGLGGATSVIVSGKATYSSPLAIAGGGLDLDNADNPGRRTAIRGAVIEVRSAAGAVLSRGNTNAQGDYALAAPINQSVTIVAIAALGNGAQPNVSVVDNTNAQAIYAVDLPVTVGAVALANQNFNASTGWDGTRYSGARSAAPFAILDVVFSAQALIRTASAGAVFPALKLNWSVNNSPATVVTSFYNTATKEITLLGAANIDTDEFDTHVLAHEWTHYFEDNFGRSDSLGGAHGLGDKLDPTVAFGEGLANAMSGMILGGDPVYVDTGRQGQAGNLLTLNVETEQGGDGTDGFWSETSVQEVIWDIFDVPADGAHSDTLALGFTPIFNVLVGRQKNTLAFTSLHSFLAALKVENAGSAGAIDTRAAVEGITINDEFQTTANVLLTVDGQPSTTNSLYTTVNAGQANVAVDVNSRPLRTSDEFLNGDGSLNKLFNRAFIRTVLPASGRVQLTATPTTSGISLFIDFPGSENRANVNGSRNVAVTFTITGVANTTHCFAVNSLEGPSTFSLSALALAKPANN